MIKQFKSTQTKNRSFGDDYIVLTYMWEQDSEVYDVNIVCNEDLDSIAAGYTTLDRMFGQAVFEIATGTFGHMP